MASRRRHLGNIILPELVEPTPGVWATHTIDIRESAVDTGAREIWVPNAHTPAQQLARLHELGHVKYSPSPWQPFGDWPEQFLSVTRIATAEKGITPDPNAVHRISKMLEENRIDWLLWDNHEVDLRPAREVLDWSLWPDPDSQLDAICTCLQLAWTVWASRGLSAHIVNLPPTRSPDPATGECFDKHWKYLCDENRELAVAMIRGCLAMYENPSNLRRNEVASELATFFPVKIQEKEEQPPTKAPEQQAQQKAEREERERQAYEEEKETGTGAGEKILGQIAYHDHTANLRRPTTRIARKMEPTSEGVDARFAHRYMLDRSIFATRRTTEGGLMIDGSGSMNWRDTDMQALMQVLPAIKIGVYASVGSPLIPWDRKEVYAKICTIARDGRFARFDGLDKGMGGANACDFEALEMLARWPRPRFWLSDGLVNSGRYSGLKPEHHAPEGYYKQDGLLYEMCDAFMKRHDILRVPDKETLHKLIRRQRVTLYRNCSNRGLDTRFGNVRYWPATADPKPVTFTL